MIWLGEGCAAGWRSTPVTCVVHSDDALASRKVTASERIQPTGTAFFISGAFNVRGAYSALLGIGFVSLSRSLWRTNLAIDRLFGVVGFVIRGVIFAHVITSLFVGPLFCQR